MRKNLSTYERHILRAFAEVLIPLDAAAPEMDPLIVRVEDQLRYFAPETRIAWRICLIAFDLLAFTYYGKCKRLTKMDRELRTRYVAAWHHTWWSVKRLLKRFLETIIFMNYYALPEVEKRIGYTPTFQPAGSTRDFPSRNLVRESPDKDVVDEVDVCVIGSGAGGSFAAMALAQQGHSVAIVEEGDFFDDTAFGEDVISMTKKLYRDGGLVNSYGWPAILLPVGKCVGGTTVINSGTCFRTPPTVFAWWVNRFGLSPWQADRMAPYFDRVEELLQVAPAESRAEAPSGRIFAGGADKLGIEVKPLMRNAPGCCGSGVCCWGCPTGAKKSVQTNAIPLALQAGARLYAQCRVRRILFTRRHATEVVGYFADPVTGKRGARIRIKARTVIVAAGTLFTPGLLARSRIPDPSGQRGRNLTLHPATKCFALMEDEVRGWKGIPQGHYADALAEEGIKLEGIFLPPAFAASTILATGTEHREIMDAYNHLAIFGMMVSDTSRGRVVSGLGGRPLIFYNINGEDLPKYQRGLTILAEAFFEAGAKKVFPSIHTLPVVTREQGAGAIAKLHLRNKDLDLQAFHPLGTCRMGADPREAVLDPYARVYGMDNLFVADGSIFPTSLGVNPQVTIMAAALRIADHIHREYL